MLWFAWFCVQSNNFILIKENFIVLVLLVSNMIVLDIVAKMFLEYSSLVDLKKVEVHPCYSIYQ